MVPVLPMYVHESETAQPIPLLTTTSGVPVATAEGAELLGSQQTSWSWLVGEVLSDEAEEYARLKFARWPWSHIIFSSEELLKQVM